MIGRAAMRPMLLEREEHNRPSLQGILRPTCEPCLRRVCLDRIDDTYPLMPVTRGGEHERDGLEMRVEEDQQCIAGNETAAFVNVVDRITDHEHAERSDERRVPCRIRHLASAWIEPVDILHVSAADGASLEVLASREGRLRAAEADEP